MTTSKAYWYILALHNTSIIIFVGNRYQFECPTCRRRTNVNELTDNRYLQEFIEFKLQQEHTTCTKHKAAITLFCNEEGCQECICVGCTVVQHRGHDIIELEDKAQSAVKLMKDGIERAKKCTEGWDEFVGEMEGGKATVNKEMDEALKKIEDTKQEFNAKIIHLSSLMEEATNKQIAQIQATNWNSITQLENYQDDINQKKSAIDRQIEKMEKQLREDHESEVIRHSQETMAELEEILQDASNINEKRITTKIPVYNKPVFDNQINIEDFGSTSDATLDIGKSGRAWARPRYPRHPWFVHGSRRQKRGYVPPGRRLFNLQLQ